MRTIEYWCAQYSNSFLSRQRSLSRTARSKLPSLLQRTMRWLGATTLIGSSWTQPKSRKRAMTSLLSALFAGLPARCCFVTARRLAFSRVVETVCCKEKDPRLIACDNLFGFFLKATPHQEFSMRRFLFKLIAPRPTRAQDMT